jgi:hypothetical protein
MTTPDFTEQEYANLLELAAGHYRFIGYDELAAEPPVVLWRHDVDYSPQRAAALARIEADHGVRTTYFFNPHSEFYNVLEEGPMQAIRKILAFGHQFGLHFDARVAASLPGDADTWLVRERELLEQAFETEVQAYSTHNPTLVAELDTRDAAAGMVNTYGSSLAERFAYCSDSNGIWRFRPLRELLETREHDRLHVLTHPGWWVPEPLPPRARISRAIDGRAAAQSERYDRLLADAGRPNVR